MSDTIRKHLGTVLRFALVGGCLFYVFSDLEWGTFWNALQQFSLWALAITAVLSVVQYLPVALRMCFLTNWEAGILTSLKASVFCLGVNNILPAKLGEVAKAYYLRKKTGIPLGKGLGLIFWERFFDLNTLLLLGLLAALMQGIYKVVLPLGAVVGSIWAMVILFRWKPQLSVWMTKVLPGEKLKTLFTDVMEQLQGRANPVFFAKLGAYSLFAWAGFAMVYMAAIWWMGGVDLTVAQIITVFVVASIGFAAPSSPGGVGVFEGAFVFAMSMFQIEKETALAVALVLRFLFFVPTVLAALIVMAQSGMSLKGIREVQVEPGKADEKECLIHEPTNEQMEADAGKSTSGAAGDPSRA